jgi:hypothetical protein
MLFEEMPQRHEQLRSVSDATLVESFVNVVDDHGSDGFAAMELRQQIEVRAVCATNHTEPPARFDLDQNTCFSEGGIVGLRGAPPMFIRAVTAYSEDRRAQDRPARRSTGASAGGNIAMWGISRRANGNYHDISKTWLAHGYLPQQGRAASLMSRSVHSGWQWKPVRSSRVMS